MRNGSPTLVGNDSLYSVEQMQLNALSELNIFTCVEGTKILLVDDQPANLDVLCSLGAHWKEYSVTPSWKLFFCAWSYPRFVYTTVSLSHNDMGF